MIVVIPSAREVRLDYLSPLIDSGARFIVVDDSEGTISIDHPSFRVFDWRDRRRMLGDLDEHFPRRNGACRDFGFYVAWHESDDDEIIVALDDDCDVSDRDFAANVASVLEPCERVRPVRAERHFNVLDVYEDVPDNVFPRGFPYLSRATYARAEFESVSDVGSDFNLGLWQGAFDVNAVDKLDGPAWEHPEARLSAPSCFVPKGSWISVCSMNMQFRRRLIPAAYQYPMHVPVMPEWNIDRYGDIWGGFTLKALMDRAGDAMSAGVPMIMHRKAGDLDRNLKQEHLCHLLNEEFIAILEQAVDNLSSTDYLDMMGELPDAFASAAQTASPPLGRYLETLAPAIEAWETALRNRG